MCNYWTNFAKNGDPNGLDADGTPMPTWTRFTADSKQNMNFFDEIAMSSGPYSERRRFLVEINKKALGI